LALFLGMAGGSVLFVAITSAVVKRVLEQQRALAAARSNLVDRQSLLIEELNHRARNIFGLVKMLVTHSIKDNGNLPDARASLLGRLEALSAAYNNVGDEAGKVTLRDMLQRLLHLHAERIRIEGCDVVLNDQALQQLTLIIHELHTNSMKYGALSSDAGVVSVVGSVKAGADKTRFSFTWEESGGPPVTPPSRRGFGQVILRQAPEIGGAAISLEYRPEGLHYVYSTDLSKITSEGSEMRSLQ
jgi:two-component sensor histidine kinase